MLRVAKGLGREIMRDRMLASFRRARDIIRTEGLVRLIRAMLSLMVWHLYRRRTYYLYEHYPDTIRDLNENQLMPRIDDFVLNVVCTNQEADEMEANGFKFRSYAAHARQSLNRGAIAFCMFAGKELAHISWVALNERAQHSINDLPLKVDYSQNEAWTGGTVTMPKYRRRGLMAYSNLKRREFMTGRGIGVARNTIATDNYIAQKVHSKFRPQSLEKVSYKRILFWESWKKIPMSEDEARFVLNL